MIRKDLIHVAYVDLIGLYLDDKLDASDFSETYISKFKLDNDPHGDKYKTLDSLFASCDAFTPYPVEGGIDLIDGKQLYLDAKSALHSLVG